MNQHMETQILKGNEERARDRRDTTKKEHETEDIP